MIPEIGQFALILALLLALTTGVLPMLGAHRGIEGWMRLAWPAARAQCGFVAIAFSRMPGTSSVASVSARSRAIMAGIAVASGSGATTGCSCKARLMASSHVDG